MADNAQTQRREIEDASDRELEVDTRDAYAKVVSDAFNRQGPAGQIQKMAKIFLKYDATFKRPVRKAARALKVLAELPLDAQENAWNFQMSLTEAFRSAIAEQAYHSHPQSENVYADDSEALYNEGNAVRGIFMAAIRTDAEPRDVARVLQATRKAGDKEDEPAEEPDRQFQSWFREKRRQIEENSK
jgi:hypothetical protein